MKTEFEKVIKRIESTNEKFDNLSNNEQKMAIAQDVIDRIKAEQLIATTGLVTSFEKNFNSSCSIKDIINTEQNKCECCAKGALFLSYVGRVNEMRLGELDYGSNHNSSEMEKLREIFYDEKELAGIEAAFEGYIAVDVDSNGDDFDYQDDYLNECTIYREKYEEKYKVYFDEEEILLSICKNIIKNKGTFNPDDIVHANLSISFRF